MNITQVKSVDNNGNKIEYTHDKNGNIETITEDGKTIKYYYDKLNELIREDNGVLNKTITYSYDVGGNMTSKVEYPYTTTDLGVATNTYDYSYDATWKDKLLSITSNKDTETEEVSTIATDAIGNSTDYNGWAFTWENGRQLAGMSGSGKPTITYKYNDSGIRTQKTVNGVTTTYHLVGDKVTYEENGTDKIYYTYDSSDTLISMNLSTKNPDGTWTAGVEYYYIRNAQGDIIGLYDGSGTQVVSYTYDSWGKHYPEVKDAEGKVLPTSGITGSLASTVGVKNPYRYRGYRYDTETGLYYLNSRYYNPEWGRFINADGLVGVTGELLTHNMFIYCNNNPVNMVDEDGYFAILIPIIWFVAEAISIVAPVVLFALTQAPAASQAATLVTANANQIIAAADTVKDKVGNSNNNSKNNNGNSNKFKNKKTKNFNKSYEKLPKNIQKAANEKFKIFKQNPNHPGLNFEKLKGLDNTYSVRINDQYRAIGRLEDGVMKWDAIIPHTYNTLGR